MRVPNTQEAAEKLVQRALQTSTEVRWAVDLTSTAAALLLAVLVSRGQPVV